MWGTSKPRQTGWYLCTIIDNYSRYVMPLERMEYPSGNWTWRGINNEEVISSIKFPKPYKGDKKV